MKFTEEQINQMRKHIIDIEAYIEKEILPHIDYEYETPEFGPIEKWGRFDENSGQRYTIRLNSGNTKVEFCHARIPYFAEEFFPEDHMMIFLQYWQNAKSHLLSEIENQKYKNDIINNFKI